MRPLRLLPVVLLAHAAMTSGQQDAIPHSVEDVRALSPEWICAVVDPTEEILAARQEKYGEELAADKEKFSTGNMAWSTVLKFKLTYKLRMPPHLDLAPAKLAPG